VSLEQLVEDARQGFSEGIKPARHTMWNRSTGAGCGIGSAMREERGRFDCLEESWYDRAARKYGIGADEAVAFACGFDGSSHWSVHHDIDPPRDERWKGKDREKLAAAYGSGESLAAEVFNEKGAE